MDAANSTDLEVLPGELDLELALDAGLDSALDCGLDRMTVLRLSEFSRVVLDNNLLLRMGDGNGARTLSGVGGGMDTVGLSVSSVGRTSSGGSCPTGVVNCENGSANILGVFMRAFVSVVASDSCVPVDSAVVTRTVVGGPVVRTGAGADA